MSQEKDPFLSYICPRCRQSVIVEKDVFALAASPTRIQCPCGQSELDVEFLPQRVRLKVPCLYCGREHLVSCSSTHAFLREKALAFSCAQSGLDCCYVGRRGRSTPPRPSGAGGGQAGATEAGERGALPGRDGHGGGPLGDPGHRCPGRHLLHLRVHSWTFQVNYSSVDLICAECGAQMRIPAATADDIDDICCKTRLLIRGKENQ